MDYLSGSLHGFLNEAESDLGRVGIDRVADWLLR